MKQRTKTMKSAIKSLPMTARYALKQVFEQELSRREAGTRTGGARHVHTFRDRTEWLPKNIADKLLSLGYVRLVQELHTWSARKRHRRFSLTPRGRRLAAQIEWWMAGIGDPPDTVYKAEHTDETGTHLELMGNAQHSTIFITVARRDDDEDDERVTEIDARTFFVLVEKFRREGRGIIEVEP